MSNKTAVMSFKSKINNYAKTHNISAQAVLQNYLFERFLERLSISEYQNKFILKGGMLISNMVGLAVRTTMDMDITIRNMQLEEQQILNALKNISNINLDDEVSFSDFSFTPIRKDDIYGGYCIKFTAGYFSIITPLSIDISTGDKIIPNPQEYFFHSAFENDKSFKLFSYNIESILAEKVQTIISRGIASTRPRDYYDVYILCKEKSFSMEIFKKAFSETCKHRGTEYVLDEIKIRLNEIEYSELMKAQWQKYIKQFSYAKEVSYEQLMETLKDLFF
jgi:predicted nucleotidyltransferase component of viral defense system